MPNFVLGRTVSATPVAAAVSIQLRDSIGVAVAGATCVVTDSRGTGQAVTLDGSGFFSGSLQLVPGVVTVTATASGYTNAPWVASGIFTQGIALNFSIFSPTPIKQATSTGRLDFGVYQSGVSVGLRNKYQWPFLATSAWNTPIGSNATYVAAGYSFASRDGYLTRLITEEEYIFGDANAPVVTIRHSDGAWGGDRCIVGGTDGNFPFNTRMPASYVVPSDGNNNVAAHVDGDTVTQHQPLARCVAGGDATSLVKFSDVNIKTSSGELGGHGGSGLSGLGGTIRYGELTNAVNNNLAYLSHALKINLEAPFFYYRDVVTESNMHRWPANQHDDYAHNDPSTGAKPGGGFGTKGYGGSNSNFKPGSLLCLKPDFNVGAIVTTIGKIMAGTLMRFGAYVTDDTTWNSCAIAIEKGPAGNVNDEYSALTQGDSWRQEPDIPFDKTSWYKDWELMAANFWIVSNNASNNVGGGGSPVLGTLTAPAFGN